MTATVVGIFGRFRLTSYRDTLVADSPARTHAQLAPPGMSVSRNVTVNAQPVCTDIDRVSPVTRSQVIEDLYNQTFSSPPSSGHKRGRCVIPKADVQPMIVDDGL